MNLIEMLSENYDINNIERIEKTKYGSGNTFIVTTNHNKFLLKNNCKYEDIEIYHYVKFDIKTFPKIYQNNKSEYLTNNSFVLYEFIDGDTFIRFDEKMTLVAIKKIKELNDSLKLINEDINLKIENDWDKIRMNRYLLENVSERLLSIDISAEWKKIILVCIDYLKENKSMLNIENYQLVHIDLGPDNFLVKDNGIVSILDFAPAINLELMSLAHFLYWNYFWFETELSKNKLKEYLRMYNGDYCNKEVERFFELSLVIACLYRAIGLLFDMENHGSINTLRLEKRIGILKWIKDNFVTKENIT